MKIPFTLLYVLGLLVIKNSVSGKSSIFNKYSNGPYFDVQKEDDTPFEESQDRSAKENVEALINSYKRSVELKPSQRNILEGSPIRKRSPYGLVYNQGKPIGILEPIPQSFEYSSYVPRDTSYRNGLYKSQWFPVKRESELEADEIDKDQLESSVAALHSNNYANVLAKFKVNNKVKHRSYQDYVNPQVKRATINQDMSRRKEMEDLKKRGALDMGELKQNTKAKAALTEDSGKEGVSKVDEIEENLKDVMGDMGLVEKDKESPATHEGGQGNVRKREIYFEDEDLENGLNKIGLTKESHNERNKKEDCPGKTKVAKSKGSRKFPIEKSLHKKGKKKARKEDEAKRSVKPNRKRVADKKDVGISDPKLKVVNYQYEGDEYIRRKRQQEKEAEKSEDSEIMKGIEASGDLTVSGNKSPLVAVNSADDAELKKSQEKRDKEELEYEKRLERNIQEKIKSIKEEVKREIGKLTEEDSQKDSQRKKREVTNTLLDGETSVLDPDLNIDEKLEPHIRKRRDLNPTLESTNSKQKREANANAGVSSTKTNAKTEKASINKIVREAIKLKDAVNAQTKKAAERTKRNNLPSPETNKREAEHEKPAAPTPAAVTDSIITKRENKAISSEKQKNHNEKTAKKVAKRSSEETELKLSAEDSKNVEKRDDSFVATDKIETDNKAEFGTDAPGSIVKREEQVSINDNEVNANSALSNDDVDVAKRDEKLVAATTDKCIDSALEAKEVSKDGASEKDTREDRSANELNDLETGQTIIKDLDLDNEKEEREGRNLKNDTFANSDNVDESNQADLQEDRQERSASKSRKAHSKDKVATAGSHKSFRRESGGKIETDLTETNLNEEAVAEKTANDAPAADEGEAVDSEEMKEKNLKRIDLQAEVADTTAEDGSTLEERSADTQKFEDTAEYDSVANERSEREREARKISLTKPTANVQDLNSEEIGLSNENSDEVVGIETRRKRAARQRRFRNRRKRDESSYSENLPEAMRYRADDGEVDDEDDEMQDDGFDDQTSNFLHKRQAEDDSNNYEGNEDQEANEDYPLYMERNKRNALRVYDDESDMDESQDNFLFYPNRFSRRKRQNYDDLVAVHGGGMTRHAAMVRERNMQPYEQNLRRKRLEKMNKMRDQNENVAELSESDIFGGFPQSYEGELSRFKRVKRSRMN